MWPQHVMIAVPLIGFMSQVNAFVAPGHSTTFVTGSLSNSNGVLYSKGKEENDVSSSSTKRSQKSANRKLAEAKCNLERMVSGPCVSVEEAEVEHGMPWSDTIGSSSEENPLLYMPFWEWQLDFMKSNLSNLVSDDCAMDNFGYRDNIPKKARLVNQCYKSDEYRKIRMTYYDAGDNTQVFNSVWYPDPAYNLPILGIDLLAFNRKKYLAIVDFQPLHEKESDHAQTYEHLLKPIKDDYESLKGRMSAKFYDETQFFSQQMLFARFEDEDVVQQDLFPAFQKYVKTHVDLIRNTTPSTDQASVMQRQVEYDTYSAERDPATGLFAAMFGKEWADDFVFNFLFSLSDRKEGDISANAGGPPPPQGAPPAPPNNKTPSEKKESVRTSSS
mmetsp:Transcript_23426/g.22479  ORF Transcript_23426/g.22479 Transcript_23426/m.22479 type:complete len:387 (-) Transcript_23426:123-1283(-)